jgi:TonB family protein
MRRTPSVVCLLAFASAVPIPSAAYDTGGRMLEPETSIVPSRPRRAALLPRVPLARAGGWILPPEPAQGDREEQAEAALDAYFDEVLMRDRIHAGEVDGWYYEMNRLMRAEFRPDQEEVQRDVRAGMTPVQILWDELRRYAVPPERPPEHSRPPDQRMFTDWDPFLRRTYEMQELCTAGALPVTWYRVVVRVTHNPEGEVSAAWVERSSGSRALDDAALSAVRRGAVMLPPPPPSVVGERQAVQSDWAFEMGDVVVPLHCGIVCVDDPVLGPMCAAGGHGIIRTRLELVRVVDAQHLTPEERRAARRGDPDRPRP